MSIDYSKKLKTSRIRKSSKPGRDFNMEMESDRGRILGMAAIRRLQQKTQVFPLESNAAVRSRLTHSLEVQQTGRYIAKTLLQRLSETEFEDVNGLKEFSEGMVSAVEMSCLLHDIGNPPFGHLGEEAITKWTSENITELFTRYEADPLYHKLTKDLCAFDGNPQGLRIIHNLQTLNLTCTQMAATLKYTRGAFEDRDTEIAWHKKPGFFYTEKDQVDKINEELELDNTRRHPLAYIMEAADDISYCIADVEDAVDKGIVSVARLIELMKAKNQKYGTDESKEHISEFIKQLEKSYTETGDIHQFTVSLRTGFIAEMVQHVSQQYIDNHEEIFNGKYSKTLIGEDNIHFYFSEVLRKIAIKYIFSNSEVESLELKGFRVLSELLEIYKPLLLFSRDSFRELVDKGSLKGKPVETRLFHRLPYTHKQRYLKVIDDSTSGIKELYHRVRLLIDYVSGMTDTYAMEEFHNLTGISY